MFTCQGFGVISNINPSLEEDVVHLRLIADKATLPVFKYAKEEIGSFQIIVPMGLMPKNASFGSRVEFKAVGYNTHRSWADNKNGGRVKDIENTRIYISEIKVVP